MASFIRFSALETRSSRQISHGGKRSAAFALLATDAGAVASSVIRGFLVTLVNARHVKNVPGRKTDLLDCQWLQRLHTYGLLWGSFRPDDSICVLRSYWRHRDNLIRYASAHIQHMQKALTEMNLHKVISDITGVTGMDNYPRHPGR